CRRSCGADRPTARRRDAGAEATRPPFPFKPGGFLAIFNYIARPAGAFGRATPKNAVTRRALPWVVGLGLTAGGPHPKGWGHGHGEGDVGAAGDGEGRQRLLAADVTPQAQRVRPLAQSGQLHGPGPALLLPAPPEEPGGAPRRPLPAALREARPGVGTGPLLHQRHDPAAEPDERRQGGGLPGRRALRALVAVAAVQGRGVQPAAPGDPAEH